MRGFTLIELAIVFAIIATLSGIGFVGGRSGDRTLALDRSSHKVAQDMRRAAGLALRTEVSGICGGAPRKLSGYGISFTTSAPNEYILYANCSGAQQGYSDVGSQPDVTIQTIALEGPVVINALEGEELAKPKKNIWKSQNKWSAAFFPPDSQVALCVNDSCAGSNKLSGARVILALKSDLTQTKTITINERGTISID